MTPAVLFRRLQVAFRKPNWLRLDNAAKIYPAARRRNWSNVFRVAATMKDEINPEILSSALEVTAARFPSIAVRLAFSGITLKRLTACRPSGTTPRSPVDE